MTDRLLRALECPHLRILGHPTGRLLLQRDPFPFDFDRVVAEAVAPRRLAGDQRQPRAARPARPADPHRQGQGRAASPFPPTRTIPSISPACATAWSPRAAAGSAPDDILNTLPADRVRRRHYRQNHENHHLKASIRVPPVPRHRRRGGRSQDRNSRSSARVVRHNGSRRDDGGRRQRSAFCWCASTACPPTSIFGNCRPAAWIPARSRFRPPNAN